MNYKDFQKHSKLKTKTKEIYEEWIGHFDYYYWRERFGEGDAVKYADEQVCNKFSQDNSIHPHS